MSDRDILSMVPECDRPYEKLELHGASSLTDSELLAVILRSGTRNQNVIEVSRNLLNAFGGSVSGVLSAGMGELEAVSGIGRVKAIQLKAVSEIAERAEREYRHRSPPGGNMNEIARFIMQEIGCETCEVFMTVLLDKRLKIICTRTVSRGTLDRTIVHPREVFAPAVRELAYAVIIAHNHPSGSVQPSTEDVELTARLSEAGSILGIRLLDHIIVSRDSFLSFNDIGLMEQFAK